MPESVITIALFSKVVPKADGSGYAFSEKMFDELANVQKIRQQIEAQFAAEGRSPVPIIKIYYHLVPDWGNGQTHETPVYLELKKAFAEKVKLEFGEFELVDFYLESGITPETKSFLEKLYSLGSILDLMKIQSIIDHDRVPNLHLDSNTTINDFAELCRRTFFDQDVAHAFNASYCSQVYLAWHAKILYCGEKASLPVLLQKRLKEFVSTIGQDQNLKLANVNAIYDYCFSAAAHDAGATDSVTVPDRIRPGEMFNFFPVNLSSPLYTLIYLIDSAQHQSWNVDLKSAFKDLDAIPHLQLENNHYDVRHFFGVIMNFTHLPIGHSLTEENRKRDRISVSQEVNELFISKLNIEHYLNIFCEYYNYVASKYPEHIDKLKKLIPDTSEGNRLCRNVFQCELQDLIKDDKNTKRAGNDGTHDYQGNSAANPKHY